MNLNSHFNFCWKSYATGKMSKTRESQFCFLLLSRDLIIPT